MYTTSITIPFFNQNVDDKVQDLKLFKNNIDIFKFHKFPSYSLIKVYAYTYTLSHHSPSLTQYE